MAAYMTISEFAIEYEDAYYFMMPEDINSGNRQWFLRVDRFQNIVAHRLAYDKEANTIKYEQYYIMGDDKVLDKVFDCGKSYNETAEYYLHEPEYKPMVTVYII